MGQGNSSSSQYEKITYSRKPLKEVVHLRAAPQCEQGELTANDFVTLPNEVVERVLVFSADYLDEDAATILFSIKSYFGRRNDALLMLHPNIHFHFTENTQFVADYKPILEYATNLIISFRFINNLFKLELFNLKRLECVHFENVYCEMRVSEVNSMIRMLKNKSHFARATSIGVDIKSPNHFALLKEWLKVPNLYALTFRALSNEESSQLGQLEDFVNHPSLSVAKLFLGGYYTSSTGGSHFDFLNSRAKPWKHVQMSSIYSNIDADSITSALSTNCYSMEIPFVQRMPNSFVVPPLSLFIRKLTIHEQSARDDLQSLFRQVAKLTHLHTLKLVRLQLYGDTVELLNTSACTHRRLAILDNCTIEKKVYQAIRDKFCEQSIWDLTIIDPVIVDMIVTYLM